MLSRLNAQTKKRISYLIKILVLLAFFIFHLYIACFHEAWRDEAQCWVLAKNLSLKDLFTLLPSEGHPILWFLVIKVLLLLGLPFKYLCVFTTVLVTVAVGILLFGIDLPMISKLCIIVSGLFFYQNPIVSRSYSLIVLLVVLILFLWEKRYERPIIFGIIVAMLFQTHIIFAGMSCGLLFIMFVRCIHERFKNRNLLVGTGIPLLSMFSLPFELLQTSSTKTDVSVNVSSFPFSSIRDLYLWRYGFHYINESIANTNSGIIYRFCQVFIVFILLFCVFAFLYGIVTKKQDLCDCTLVALASYAMSYFVIIIIYKGSVQMCFTAFLSTTLFICTSSGKYLSKYYKYPFLVAFSLYMLVSSGYVYENAINDLNNASISDSVCFSNYISDSVPENSIILITENFAIPSAYAYLCDIRPDICFYSIDKNETYSVHLWGTYFEQLSLEEWNNIVNSFDSNCSIYYWNTSAQPTAPTEILNTDNLIYDNLSKGIFEGNQLYCIRDVHSN